MNESFLQFVWQYQLFENRNVKALSGESVSIIKQGTLNTNSGPDFSMAHIDINNTRWVGHVEIHLKSSDWFLHQHQNNKNYDRIVLHVVAENDLSPDQLNKIPAPTIEIKDLIFPKTQFNYLQIKESQHQIPCQNMLSEIDNFRFRSGLHRLVIERMEEKTKDILNRLKKNKNHWEETMYQMVAYAFGLKINATAFLQLAESLPLKIIATHKSNAFQIEALLMGQAGMLQAEFQEEYPRKLKTEYQFLAKKYQLTPMDFSQWHFLRLRPAAFPTLRIAQFAQLLFKSNALFSKILAQPQAKDLFHLLTTEGAAYWQTHYRFDYPSAKRSKKLGRSALQVIIQNSVVPVLFAYGITHDDEKIMNQATEILESLPPEKNKIIDQWTALHRKPRNASESQALIQLKNNYCLQKRCLQCHIGVKLLKLG